MLNLAELEELFKLSLVLCPEMMLWSYLAIGLVPQIDEMGILTLVG